MLNLWEDLARRCAVASAHDHPEAPALLRSQVAAEEAIRERHPEMGRVLDDLLTWEASLVHIGPGPSSTCLTCRRITLGLPLDLPFPQRVGGLR